MKYEYYVIIRRCMKMENDIISIESFSEAVENNWINSNGERVWVVSPKDEKNITFIWGFNSHDKAKEFYEILASNAIGIKPIDNNCTYNLITNF